MTRRLLFFAMIAISLVSRAVGGADEPAASELAPQEAAFFESQVRPILVERCYSCHSLQAENVRGNLRLDSREATLKGGDLGPAIEPGDPESSWLVLAVKWDDESLKMPPKGKIPDDEIAILTDWVKRGAPDPRIKEEGAAKASKPRVIDYEEGKKHWAFQPLGQVEPPVMGSDDGWATTPIDRFLLAAMREQGLEPSPPADRATLIRRLYLDVLGLPPAPEEVEAFVNDEDPRAYEHLVDRALASPHFGERWARHWLDLARFGESHGFEHDYDRPSAYHYRDFLIEALNQDLPYDQFVSWQLAGDELAPSEPLAQKATGFLAAGVHSTQITASQAEKERYDELDDMANTTGTAFLGLTIGCARCHDHKYDPIAMADYYRIVATFTTTVRSEIDLDLDAEGYRERKAAFDAEHQPYLQALADFEKNELPARLAAWEQNRAEDHQSDLDSPWLVLDLVETKSGGGATFTKQADGSVLLSGNNPQHETLTFTAHTDRLGITAIRLETLADPSLAKGGPGRASNGNFALSDFTVAAAPRDKPAEKTAIKLQNPRATFEQSGLPVAAAIDQDGTSAWAIDPQFGKSHAASFEAETPFGFEGGTLLTFTLRFTNNLNHGIGRPRLALTTAAESVPLEAASIPQATLALLETAPESRTPEQSAALLAWYGPFEPDWQVVKAAEVAHAANAPRPSVVKALISTEGLPAVRLHTQGPDFYEETYMLRRGDPNQKIEVTSAGFLPVLVKSSEEAQRWRKAPAEGWRTSYRRAALAGWMTDTEAGAGTLLARVAVNRLWQHAFGRGLVATPSDFGAQGEPPTHPELLDWLAAELVRGDWHLKPVLRLILTSAAYRQRSHIDESKASIDIDNRLYWRQNRRRLEAEVIRDAMLAISGQLDDSMLGPGTLDEGMKRRSIYFTIKRSKLIPMMSQFDAPDALVPIATRSTTTVAPQALLLINSPLVRSWAESLARRVKAEATSPDPASQVERAYRLALSRPPDPTERAEAIEFLKQQTQAREGKPEAAALALADFCQVLFASNEFVFVE